MEVMLNPNDREYQAAKILEDFINDFGWNPDKFAQACCTMHRTLQQSLFRTIVKVLIAFASENRGTDPRNEASKKGSQRLLEVLREINAPFI